MKPDRAGRLAARAAELGAPIEPRAAALLIELLDRIAVEPQNLTAIEGVDEGIDRHLLDSLVALAHPASAAPAPSWTSAAAAGFPGLALAAARPAMAVTLVESERRKAEWLRRASAAFPNVRVVADRSEHLAAGEREAFPVAVARALGPPPVALELAAPWSPWAARWCSGAATRTIRGTRPMLRPPPGCSASSPRPRSPCGRSRARARLLQSFAKVRPTPRYPRRPGRAASRPLGAGARR